METVEGRRRRRTPKRFRRTRLVLRGLAIVIGTLGVVGWCLFGTWMLYALMVR